MGTCGLAKEKTASTQSIAKRHPSNHGNTKQLPQRLVRDLGFVHCQPVLALAAVSLCQRVKGMLVLILAANETAKLTWLKKTGLSGYLFLLEETLHFCRLGRDCCVAQKSSLVRI